MIRARPLPRRCVFCVQVADTLPAPQLGTVTRRYAGGVSTEQLRCGGSGRDRWLRLRRDRDREMGRLLLPTQHEGRGPGLLPSRLHPGRPGRGRPDSLLAQETRCAGGRHQAMTTHIRAFSGPCKRATRSRRSGAPFSKTSVEILRQSMEARTAPRMVVRP